MNVSSASCGVRAGVLLFAMLLRLVFNPGKYGKVTLCSSILLLCIPAMSSINSSPSLKTKEKRVFDVEIHASDDLILNFVFSLFFFWWWWRWRCFGSWFAIGIENASLIVHSSGLKSRQKLKEIVLLFLLRGLRSNCRSCERLLARIFLLAIGSQLE